MSMRDRLPTAPTTEVTPEQAALLALFDRMAQIEALLAVERSGRLALEFELGGRIKALRAEVAQLQRERG